MCNNNGYVIKLLTIQLGTNVKDDEVEEARKIRTRDVCIKY